MTWIESITPWTEWIITWVVWIVVIINILGAIIASTYLIHKLKKTDKESLSKTVSIAGSGIAAISLLWAAYTYYDSAKRQKELAAYSIYQEHQKLSIQYKKFLGPSELANKEPPTKYSSDEEKREYEPYQWYVGNALFSFESILEVLPNDGGWNDTFRGFIEDHQKYLCYSYEFDLDRYSNPLQQLIKKTLRGKCPKYP